MMICQSYSYYDLDELRKQRIRLQVGSQKCVERSLWDRFGAMYEELDLDLGKVRIIWVISRHDQVKKSSRTQREKS